MSAGEVNKQTEKIDLIEPTTGKIDLIEPTTGKLFFEKKNELVFCKPQLLPLKNLALERLEEMQRETARQLQQKRMPKNRKSNNVAAC